MAAFRRTKMVITLGPALDDYDRCYRALSYANIVRMNFSHGSHEEHLSRLKMVREIEDELGRPITVMADLKGPEVRTANKDPIDIKEGELYSVDDIPLSPEGILEQTLEEGDLVLVDDGAISFIVVGKEGDFFLLAENSGTIKSRKSVVVRGKDFPLPSIGKEDKENIKFIKKHGFDAVAQSFVRSPSDVSKMRGLINEDMVLIAKIESVDATKNIEPIIERADGLMVARGDLALSLPEEIVPSLQVELIKKCRAKRKPVIVATQMLESMTENPMPTRAEVNDVYTSVLEGADALMLSGETAKGKYPLRAILVMDRVIREAEKRLDSMELPQIDVKDVMATSAIKIANKYDCDIIAPTLHGTTPTKLSRQRPRRIIYSVTPLNRTIRYLNFYYGILPKKMDFEPVFENFEKIKEAFAVEEAVFVFGYPPKTHKTNTIILI